MLSSRGLLSLARAVSLYAADRQEGGRGTGGDIGSRLTEHRKCHTGPETAEAARKSG